MSGFENLKFSTVQYRPPDPIENLRFRVEINRLSEGRGAGKKKKASGRVDSAAIQRVRAREEMGGVIPDYEPPVSFNAEFKWQEKKFALFNIPRYLGEEGKNAEPGSIRSVYRDHIMERIVQGRRNADSFTTTEDMALPSDISSPVYSYVEQDIAEHIAGEVADRFEYAREVAKADTDMDSWMSKTTRRERKEIRELAATSVLDVRFARKNQLGKIIQKAFKLFTGEDPKESRELVGDGVPEKMRQTPPKRMMVCFQANAEDESGHVDQLVLCYLNYHKSGLLEVRPGFGDKKYRVTAHDGAVYEYSLSVTSENAESVMDKRRGRLYRDISRLQGHGGRYGARPPSKFVLPAFQGTPGAPYPLTPNAIRVYYNIEIVSCGNFVNVSNLYVEWKVHVNRDVWGDIGEETEKNLQGNTHLVALQTIYEPVEGSQSNVGTYVAHFSHPIELEMTSLEDPLGQFPVLSMAVRSYDSWDRSSTEGYAHVRMGAYSTGSHEVYVDTWRLEGSLREERDRFFVGGGPDLNDINYVGGVPTWASKRVGRDGKEHASNQPLSRLGLRTVSGGGQVKLRINSLIHQNRPMEEAFQPAHPDMSSLTLTEGQSQVSPRGGHTDQKYVDHKAVIAKARMRLEDKRGTLKPKSDLSNKLEYPETKALPEPEPAPAPEIERRQRRRRASTATPRRTPREPEPAPEPEPTPEPVELPPPPEDLVSCMECMRTHDQDKMASCDKCGCSYHLSCLAEPLTERPTNWTCDNCRPAPSAGHPCDECGLQVQPELQVQCFKCSRWYHIYCLTPSLNQVPEGQWQCPQGQGCWEPPRLPTPPPEERATSRTPTPPLEEEEEEAVALPDLPVPEPRTPRKGYRDIFQAIGKELEVKQLRLVDFFNKFDTARDLSISKEELLRMIRSVVPDATNEEIRYFQVIMQRKPGEGISFDHLSTGIRDAKSLGQISPHPNATILDCLYLAFLDLVDNSTGGNRKKLRDLFREVDKHNDGILKKDEFKKLVVKVLPGATNAEANTIIDNLHLVDVNNDDQVDFEEFANVVLERRRDKAEMLETDQHSGMRSDMGRLMRRRA